MAPSPPRSPSTGWVVTFAGTGINLALGILYTWSVISGGVPAAWNWSETEKSLPYSIACLTFCILMVPAGRMQDRVGPRLTAAIGGVLVGLGMILSSFTTSPLGFIAGFGIFAGAGMGFGYAAATPPAVKWFPKARTGLIAGLVVSGFGLASIYAAPLSQALIDSVGLSWTVRILGIAFVAVVVALSTLLKAPPAGYEPEGAASAPGTAPAPSGDVAPLDVLKTSQFYLMWILYTCGAGAGLMIISKLKKIADLQAGIQAGFLLVAFLAVGNGGGRILAGVASDRLGRTRTLVACFLMQALWIFLLSLAARGSFLAGLGPLLVLSALIGACYGANLSLFPSLTKDYYGLKNFGMNYGLVFTAWGVGGFMLSLAAGWVYDRTQSFAFAYWAACGILVAAAALTFALRPPRARAGA